MSYLLDTHALTGTVLHGAKYRNQVFVIRDVADEFGTSKAKADSLARSNVQTRELQSIHYEALKTLLKTYGGNTKLINLLTNEGKGDVLMLAFAIAERARPGTLIPEICTIVSKDKELVRIAKALGIPTMTQLL